MKLTPHIIDLFSLLVNDTYGEIPHRVIDALLRRGGSHFRQLQEWTELSAQQVRHGLATLIQHNLLHYATRPETGHTTYKANVEACCALQRIGKIIEVVGKKYGRAEQEVVRSVVALGHVEVTDLAQAFGAETAAKAREIGITGPSTSPSHQTNGESSERPTAPVIQSVFHLHEIVGRLIQWEILAVVEPETFANPEDVYSEIDELYNKQISAAKGPKAKDELSRTRALKLREARDRGKQLKRRLDSEDGFPSLKRRKIERAGSVADDSQHGQRRILDDIVVRLNYEKCLVDLRNERLVHFAADFLGDTTSQVYESLLGLVSQHIPRCNADPRIDGAHSSMFEDDSAEMPTVTTTAVLENLNASTSLSAGIARVSKDKIDDDAVVEARLESERGPEETSDEVGHEGARRVAKRRRTANLLDSESDEEDNKDFVAEGEDASKQNGVRSTLVKFENVPAAKDKRLDLVRRHLTLLCNDRRGFAKASGRRDEERWTVDFDVVMDSLREVEMDSIIERTAGRFGIRLMNTLRECGRLGEKSLARKALMKMPRMQATMALLQRAGLVDIQEVPKDSSRAANRTIFLWFCDTERIRRQLPDRLCKIILRCFQTLEVERHKTRDILDFVHRTDVKGREEEVMRSNYYEGYRRYMELENQLLSHAMRLDEIVAVLRDY